jgi:hypothetical protein
MVMVITKNGQYNKLRCPGMLLFLPQLTVKPGY